MHFSHPFLAGAIATTALAFTTVLIYGPQNWRASALRISSVKFVVESLDRSRRWWALLAVIKAAGIFGAALIIAGPSYSKTVAVRNLSAVICVDVSGSMASSDVKPSRAAAVSMALRTYLSQLPGTVNLGIVAFSGTAQIMATPTDSEAILMHAIDSLPPPNGQTAIGDALELARKSLPGRGPRLVVVLTDGVNNRGIDPAIASRELTAAGVHVRLIRIPRDGTRDSAGIQRDLMALSKREFFEAHRTDLSPHFAAAGAVLSALATLLTSQLL